MTPLDVAQILIGGLSRQSTGPFTNVPEQLYVGTLGNVNGTLYTAPSANTVANEMGLGPRVRIRSIIVCNISGTPNFTLYVVESGGTAADNRALFKAYPLTANQTLTLVGLDIIVPTGGTIQGLASAGSAVTLCISGEILYAP